MTLHSFIQETIVKINEGRKGREASSVSVSLTGSVEFNVLVDSEGNIVEMTPFEKQPLRHSAAQLRITIPIA